VNKFFICLIFGATSSTSGIQLNNLGGGGIKLEYGKLTNHNYAVNNVH